MKAPQHLIDLVNSVRADQRDAARRVADATFVDFLRHELSMGTNQADAIGIAGAAASAEIYYLFRKFLPWSAR